MKKHAISEAETFLDGLAAEPDFAGHVAALRSLVNDGLTAGEIGFMTRGMFPEFLIAALVEARRIAREPVIEVGDATECVRGSRA